MHSQGVYYKCSRKHKVFTWCQDCVLDAFLCSDLLTLPTSWIYGKNVTVYFLPLSELLSSFPHAWNSGEFYCMTARPPLKGF